MKAIYWQEEVELVGKVKRPLVLGEDIFVCLEVEGSPSESVVKFATASRSASSLVQGGVQ